MLRTGAIRATGRPSGTTFSGVGVQGGVISPIKLPFNGDALTPAEEAKTNTMLSRMPMMATGRYTCTPDTLTFTSTVRPGTWTFRRA